MAMSGLTVWHPGHVDLVVVEGDVAGARSAIAAAELVGEQQEVCRQRFFDLLDAHGDALVRTCRPGHLTGSSLVVEFGAERVLVLWHNKAKRWLQPGGHADGDGNLAHVAWREATEETGINGLAVVVPAVHVDIHEFRPPDEDPHLHFDVRYVVLAPPGATTQPNHESGGLRWVTFDELVGLRSDPGLLELATRGLELARSLDADQWPQRP
jgi:8-oxo-dGTP pyrophosphatase MutT (NUDIX family)